MSLERTQITDGGGNSRGIRLSPILPGVRALYNYSRPFPSPVARAACDLRPLFGKKASPGCVIERTLLMHLPARSGRWRTRVYFQGRIFDVTIRLAKIQVCATICRTRSISRESRLPFRTRFCSRDRLPRTDVARAVNLKQTEIHYARLLALTRPVHGGRFDLSQ